MDVLKSSDYTMFRTKDKKVKVVSGDYVRMHFKESLNFPDYNQDFLKDYVIYGEVFNTYKGFVEINGVLISIKLEPSLVGIVVYTEAKQVPDRFRVRNDVVAEDVEIIKVEKSEFNLFYFPPRAKYKE